MRNEWKKWEVELLESKLDMSLDDLQRLYFPTRTGHSLRWKAKKLGKKNWIQAQVYRTQEEEKEIIDCFRDLGNAQEVAKKLGHGDRGQIVLYILKKHGIKTKGRSYSRSCRKDIPTYVERDLDSDLNFKY